MEQVREDGKLVRRALMIGLVIAIALSPFFYHLVNFLLIPIIIMLIALFAFVFFTGLTDFEKRKMIILNIVFAVVVIGIYELYLWVTLSKGSHQDIHVNIAVWLVQIIAVNFLFVLYHSVKSLGRWRKARQLEEMEKPRSQGSEAY